MMYSKGLDISPDELLETRACRSSEGRNALSGSKRKQGSQLSKTAEVIRNAMKFAND